MLSDGEIADSLPAKSRASIRDMVAVLSEMGQQWESGQLKVSDIYDNLLIRTGYMKALEDANTVEAEGRIENLLEFKSVIYDEEKDNPNVTLSEFMEKIALIAEVDNHNPDEDAVVMMTMHSAKGLEFPVVFLPGMEDGLFPSWRSYDKGSEGVEEERRLCYVGMTRAREKLYLTSAETRTLYGKTDFTRESQFLREVDPSLLEGHAVYSRKNPAQSQDRYRIDESFRSSPNSGGSFSHVEVNRPFQQIQKIKTEVARSASQAKGTAAGGQNLTQGDKVKHPKFGEGLVIEVSGSTVTVAFDSCGIKKLAKDIAPLTKL